ncbi:MAG: HEAT repeat domain-containing protein [Isosphaeraceae bacterium]
MSQPGKKRFGPLIPAAIVAGALVSLYYGIELAGPTAERWAASWRVARQARSADPLVRLQALQEIEREDTAYARPYLLAALEDPVIDVRLAACRGLANRGVDLARLVPILEAATAHPDEAARSEAAEILGIVALRFAIAARIPPPGGVEPDTGPFEGGRATLRRLLRDPSSKVRSSAVPALGAAGPDPESIRALEGASGDEDAEVRLAIASTLMKLAGPDDPRGVGILIRLITDPEPLSYRDKAFGLLRGIGEESQGKVISALADFLGRADPAILPEVIQLAGGLPQPGRLAPSLVKLLAHPDPVVRGAAALTAASIQEGPDPRVFAALNAMIADRSFPPDVRSRALETVIEKSPSALIGATPGLLRQLADPDLAVRQSALALISSIIEHGLPVLPEPGN